MFAHIIFQALSYIVFSEFNQILFHNSKNSCDKLSLYPLAFLSRHCYNNLDFHSSTEEMILRHGYQSIAYSVITDDGYILTVYRIPPKHNNTHNTPVFLQHGISSDSSSWVDIGNRSLAFKLSDEGYDVWLGNLRGTTYSKHHRTLKPEQKSFWDYNLDKMAQFDIRASLKLVADHTQREGEIIYFGYSLGSTLIFMYSAEHPEESSRLLRGIVAFSPVVYFEPHLLMKTLLRFIPLYGKVLQLFGVHALYSHPEKSQNFYQQFCKFLPHVCITMINIQYGKTYQMRPEDLLLFFNHYPDALSVQQMIHYGQLYKTGRFQKYDYGKRGNLRAYNSAKPPVYDLSKIEIPTSLYYGKQDSLISETTTEKIFKELGGTNNYMHCAPVQSTRKEDQFNHMDFVYAANITDLLYEDLFQRIYEITQGL